ncbi:hypothetical protein [Aetokthonos hydrillicola]|uniref:hypothetical protein n=1 Tax=Aetokthonos hydrillicola TaxID=1550245 RepID=UPI001ABB0DF3|nr:hypothetical protein [Aetokthonos hydrillicola]
MLIAYVLPVALIMWFVTNFNVNIPFWDEWSLVSFFDKFASDNAKFGDFFAQNNEHRLFFPKIIFIILAFTSSWDTTREMYFSIFLVIVSFCAIYRIASDNPNQDKILFHLFNITTCLLLFSLVQWENWLWGFQLAWFFINTCVILSIFFLVVPKKLLPILRLSISAILCFIASFSSAHGLFSWISLVPTVASVEGSNRQKKVRLLVWILLFVLSLFIYQIGYIKPSNHPDIFFFFKKPLIAITYLLTLLGSSIGKVFIPVAILGFIITFSFVLFNIYYLKNYKSDFARNATPWLSLGWFTTLFALLTTLGRAGFGVEQAKSSRYTSVTVLLVIALLQILRLLIYYKLNCKIRNIYKRSLCIFVIIFLIWVSNSDQEIGRGRGTWIERTSGKTCFEIIHFIDPSLRQQPNNCLDSISPREFQLIETSEILQRIGFRNFPRDIAFTEKTIKNYGYIDSPTKKDKPLIVDNNEDIRFSGWVVLPDGKEQPQLVLLSYNDKKSFFANAVVKVKKPVVAQLLNSSDYQKSRWSVDVSLSSIPVGESVIKAWVYDPNHKQFVKLNNEIKIKKVHQLATKAIAAY